MRKPPSFLNHRIDHRITELLSEIDKEVYREESDAQTLTFRHATLDMIWDIRQFTKTL